MSAGYAGVDRYSVALDDAGNSESGRLLALGGVGPGEPLPPGGDVLRRGSACGLWQDPEGAFLERTVVKPRLSQGAWLSPSSRRVGPSGFRTPTAPLGSR